LPSFGFAVGHKGPLPDLYDLDLAAFHFFVEQRAANAVGATEIVYTPVYAVIALLVTFIGVWHGHLIPPSDHLRLVPPLEELLRKFTRKSLILFGN
jgi:hypothetical protein